VPHLIELQNKYAEKGLTIMAITEPGADQFVKENKINYAVGLGGSTAATYGVTGIPQTYLIDARGKVAWEGHTASETDVEGLLAKVRLLPKRDWPKSLEKVAKAAQAGNLGEASKLLDKAKPEDPAAEEAAKVLREYIDGKVSDTFADVEDLEKDEDYYAANATLAAAKKSFAGLDAEDKAAEKLKAYQKDKKISGAIKAGAIYEQAAALEQQKKYKEAAAAYAQAAKAGAGSKIGEKSKAKAQEMAAK
jgi:hypothetical protein